MVPYLYKDFLPSF